MSTGTFSFLLRAKWLIAGAILYAAGAAGQPLLMQGNSGGKSDSTLTMIPARWEKVPVVRPDHWVNDFEKSLTGSQERYIDSLLNVLYKKTTIEMFVVTVDTSMSRKEMFSDLGMYMLKNWFATADSNSWGGLVLVSKGLRKIRVLSNENLEQFISEAEMKTVVEEGFMPGFRAGDFYRGVKEGTTKLTITLRKNYKAWVDRNAEQLNGLPPKE